MSALAAFVVAGIVLVVLFVGLSYVIGRAQANTLKRLQTNSTQVKRWGGWVLVTVRARFVILAIWAESFAGILPGEGQVEARA